MRFPVGVKLALALGTLVILTTLLAAAEYEANRTLRVNVERLFHGGVRATEAIGRASTMLQRIRGRSFFHVATRDAGEQASVERELADFERSFFEALSDAEALLPAENRRAERIRRVRELYREFARRRSEEVFPRSRAGETVEALSLMSTRTGPVILEASEVLRELSLEQVLTNERVYRDAEDSIDRVSAISVYGSLGAALIALTLGIWLSRVISRRLLVLTGTARRLGGGDLSARAEVRGGDEIADLAAVYNTAAERLSTMLDEQRRATEREARDREQLARAVAAYGAFVERVSRGDLTAEPPSVDQSELAGLGRNLAAMNQGLRAMTLQIHDAVGSLSSASAELQATAQEHATGAAESASAVAETVATVDEVTQSAHQMAERAKGVQLASQRSIEVSGAGTLAVRRSVDAMEAVREQVGSIATRILALSEQAQTVGQITATVNELAEQSNLLALNASIEAARAGEGGRGFAIVAQEIRALAEQSRQATARIRDILGAIQKSTSSAVLATEEGTKAAATATDTAREAGERIEQLAEVLEVASQSAEQILSAAQQQVQGVSQISQAMRSIDDASRQTVEGTRHIDRAARDLTRISTRLQEAASQYRT